MTDITLVNPPQHTRYPQAPMGIALLGAVLEEAGYGVTVIDANASALSPEQVGRLVSTDIIGLTAVTPTASAAIAIAREIRGVRPESTIIMGGAHATLLPEATLTRAPEIDIIVRGEAENTLPRLLAALTTGKLLDEVPGIYFRRDGGISKTADSTEPVNLDGLPFLAYHLLPWRDYRPHPPHGRALPFAALITSRGCPYHCSYCSKPIFGNRFRAQRPERVLAEISHLKEKYGVREIAFYDDVFTLDKKRVHAICEGLLTRGLNLHWTCETRVNLVDEELLRHMKAAGCYSVAYGIESADSGILQTLQKDITPEQVVEAVRQTRRAGLETVGYFMLGSPGETLESINATIGFASDLKLDFAQFSVTTPFPGTELYELLGKRRDDIAWDSYIYSGGDRQILPLFESQALSREDLLACSRRAYRSFYLRPGYIWQRLSKLRTWGDVKVNWNGLGMLMDSVRSRKG